MTVMTNNIFENAYFGKAYKTRDGRKAVYIQEDCCIVEGNMDTFSYFDDGHCSMFSEECDIDIVSEWQEPINEEKLDEVLNKAEELRKSAEGRKLTGGWHWRKWAEWGYRKAYENTQKKMQISSRV